MYIIIIIIIIEKPGGQSKIVLFCSKFLNTSHIFDDFCITLVI